jgi:hypothetical protein
MASVAGTTEFQRKAAKAQRNFQRLGDSAVPGSASISTNGRAAQAIAHVYWELSGERLPLSELTHHPFYVWLKRWISVIITPF